MNTSSFVSLRGEGGCTDFRRILPLARAGRGSRRLGVRDDKKVLFRLDRRIAYFYLLQCPELS